jgi:hypothetical protein
MRLLPGPAKVQMYFVEPHVKRGDYHLFINPITGRRMWAYPRMMGERRFPVVSALGTDTADWMDMFNPQRLVEQVDSTREEIGRTQTYLKLAIGASLITSAVAIYALTRRDRY